MLMEPFREEWPCDPLHPRKAAPDRRFGRFTRFRGSLSCLLIMCIDLHNGASLNPTDSPLTAFISVTYVISCRWLAGCNSPCACQLGARRSSTLDDLIRERRRTHRSFDECA